jgi:hypothetical protein
LTLAGPTKLSIGRRRAIDNRMIRDMVLVTARMIVLSLLPLLVIPTHARKQEKVCEVVARVNGESITQHAYVAALRDDRGDLSWQMVLRGKSEREIDAELERSKLSLLDDLIDELLLAQRGKQLGFDADVELKRIQELVPPGYRDYCPQSDAALRRQGIDLEEARASGRRQALGQRAIQVELFEPILNSITDGEQRDFYDNHKEKFMLPATVTLSEVFLPFRGQSEPEVAQRTVKLLAELRAGADSFKAVAQNTPALRPSYETKGSLGMFRLSELKESLAIDLVKINPGEFTALQLDNGYQINRLDARMSATVRSFDDPMTRVAVSRFITMSRAVGLRKSYIAGLREKARIEVCPAR